MDCVTREYTERNLRYGMMREKMYGLATTNDAITTTAMPRGRRWDTVDVAGCWLVFVVMVSLYLDSMA